MIGVEPEGAAVMRLRSLDRGAPEPTYVNTTMGRWARRAICRRPDLRAYRGARPPRIVTVPEQALAEAFWLYVRALQKLLPGSQPRAPASRRLSLGASPSERGAQKL